MQRTLRSRVALSWRNTSNRHSFSESSLQLLLQHNHKVWNLALLLLATTSQEEVVSSSPVPPTIHNLLKMSILSLGMMALLGSICKCFHHQRCSIFFCQLLFLCTVALMLSCKSIFLARWLFGPFRRTTVWHLSSSLGGITAWPLAFGQAEN